MGSWQICTVMFDSSIVGDINCRFRQRQLALTPEFRLGNVTWHQRMWRSVVSPGSGEAAGVWYKLSIYFSVMHQGESKMTAVQQVECQPQVYCLPPNGLNRTQLTLWKTEVITCLRFDTWLAWWTHTCPPRASTLTRHSGASQEASPYNCKQAPHGPKLMKWKAQTCI